MKRMMIGITVTTNVMIMIIAVVTVTVKIITIKKIIIVVVMMIKRSQEPVGGHIHRNYGAERRYLSFYQDHIKVTSVSKKTRLYR